MRLAACVTTAFWLGLGACARTPAAPPEQPAARAVQLTSQDCPAAVAGVQIDYEDTPDGAQISFIAPGFQLRELRANVEGMVQSDLRVQRDRSQQVASAPSRSGARAAGGGLSQTPGVADAGPPPDVSDDALPPATVSIDHVPGGANVVYRPADPAQLARLRSAVRSRVQMLQLGQCPHEPR